MKKEENAQKKIVSDNKVSKTERTINFNQDSCATNAISTSANRFLRIGAIISACALFLLCCFSVVSGLLPFGKRWIFTVIQIQYRYAERLDVNGFIQHIRKKSSRRRSRLPILFYIEHRIWRKRLVDLWRRNRRIWNLYK